MTENQLLSAVSQIPIAELISLLTAISNRDYLKFTQLESNFVTQHGVEVWEEYFNFRLLSSLDSASSNWLLEQKIGAEAYQELARAR